VKVGSIQYPSIVLSTEFLGTDYSTPATYFVPDDNEQLAYGGQATEIDGNTVGIRDGVRTVSTIPSYTTPATVVEDHLSEYTLTATNDWGSATTNAYLLITGESLPGAGATSPDIPIVTDIQIVEDTITMYVSPPETGADTFRASLIAEDGTEVTYAQRDGEGTLELTIPERGVHYGLSIICGNYGSPAVWSHPGLVSSIYRPALASQVTGGTSEEAQSAGPLGVGLQFPFRISESTGSVEISYDIEHVKESMRQIIGTVINQRFIRREFGTNLNTSLLKAIPNVELDVVPRIALALEKWEHRIRIINFETTTDEARGLIEVKVDFEIIRTYEVGNLVYPMFVGS
jgi:phage baseplate assembly protein W